MERLNGNSKLYLKLLHTFQVKHQDFHTTLERIVKKGDWESLHRSVHTLKGVSGNLGMMKLHGACEILDKKIKHRENHDLNILLYDVYEALEKVL